MTRYEGAARLVALGLVVALLDAGCGTMFPRYLGMRPDAPDVAAPSDVTYD